jgi:hypothetical protein
MRRRGYTQYPTIDTMTTLDKMGLAWAPLMPPEIIDNPGATQPSFTSHIRRNAARQRGQGV